ncbi:MAG: CPBP family intramembrane glutamic endopeptidase [Myxococcota bacterium]
MENHPIRDGGLVRTAAIFYAVLLGLALGVSTLTGHPLLYADPAADRGIDWPRDPAVGALAAGLVIALSALLSAATRWGEALSRALAELLGPLRPRDCLLLAAMSGVAEEALFRGALQPLVGWVAASLLFGLAHFAPRRELWPWTGFTVAAGFGLGWLYEATGNLVAPVVAHFGVNAVNLWLLSRRRPGAGR